MPSQYWSVAQCHSGKEAQSLTHLRRQNFVALFPYTLTKYENRHTRMRPLFPGYVFVLVDTVRSWAPVNNTHGIIRLLTSFDREAEVQVPSRVPDPFMESMKRCLISENRLRDRLYGQLDPGTVVRIKTGPFVERLAVITGSDEDRIKLLLRVFNREVELEFLLEDLEVLPDTVAA